MPWIPGEHRRGIWAVDCVAAHLRGFEENSRSEVVFWIDEWSSAVSLSLASLTTTRIMAKREHVFVSLHSVLSLTLFPLCAALQTWDRLCLLLVLLCSCEVHDDRGPGVFVAKEVFLGLSSHFLAYCILSLI